MKYNYNSSVYVRNKIVHKLLIELVGVWTSYTIIKNGFAHAIFLFVSLLMSFYSI